LNDAQRAVLTDAEQLWVHEIESAPSYDVDSTLVLTLLAALADERIALLAAVQRVAPLEAEVARLTVDYCALQDRWDAQHVALTEIAAERDAAKARIVGLLAELDSQFKWAQSVADARDAAEQRAAIFERQVGRLRESNAFSQSGDALRVAALEAEVAALGAQLITLAHANDKVEAENTAWERRMDAFQHGQNNLRQCVAKLEAERDELRRQLADAEQRATAAEDGRRDDAQEYASEMVRVVWAARRGDEAK